jgi:hypothetical protein
MWCDIGADLAGDRWTSIRTLVFEQCDFGQFTRAFATLGDSMASNTTLRCLQLVKVKRMYHYHLELASLMRTLGGHPHLESLRIDTTESIWCSPLISLLSALEDNPESRLRTLELPCHTHINDPLTSELTRLLLRCRVDRLAIGAHLDPGALERETASGSGKLPCRELLLHDCVDDANCAQVGNFLARAGGELTAFSFVRNKPLGDLPFEEAEFFSALEGMARLERLSLGGNGSIPNVLGMLVALRGAPHLRTLEIHNFADWSKVTSLLQNMLSGEHWDHPEELATINLGYSEAFSNVNSLSRCNLFGTYCMPAPVKESLGDICHHREKTRAVAVQGAFAAACGTHDRLGADSPLQCLSTFVLGEIYALCGIVPRRLDVRFGIDCSRDSLKMLTIMTDFPFPPFKRAKYF